MGGHETANYMTLTARLSRQHSADNSLLQCFTTTLMVMTLYYGSYIASLGLMPPSHLVTFIIYQIQLGSTFSVSLCEGTSWVV